MRGRAVLPASGRSCPKAWEANEKPRTRCMLAVTEAPSVRQAAAAEQYAHVPYLVKAEHHGGKKS